MATFTSVSSPTFSKILKKYVPACLALAGLVLLAGPMQAKAPRIKTSHVKIRPMAFSAATVLGPGTVAADMDEVPDTGQKYSLRLYSLHTNENINVVYRIGDVYLPGALDQLNHFLRDHYTDDVKQYDPSEFDLLHNVLTRLNKLNGTINILCGYRTEETNEYLRSLAPVTGVQKVLAKAGWKMEDVDLFELNEAFAVQALGVTKELGLDLARVNVNGGAVAIGHPIGASGARVLVTLLHEMVRRDAKKGVAALCLGGGNSVALAVER